MKILKIKLGIFSLLTMLVFSIFLTSCEQELDITSATELSEINQLQPHEISLMFELPEEFNEMSQEEIKVFFDNTSEEELSELMTVLTQKDIEMRGCDDYGNWEYLGTTCLSSIYCSNKREIKRYRRKCVRNNWFDSWEYAYGSWRDCCG